MNINHPFLLAILTIQSLFTNIPLQETIDIGVNIISGILTICITLQKGNSKNY